MHQKSMDMFEKFSSSDGMDFMCMFGKKKKWRYIDLCPDHKIWFHLTSIANCRSKLYCSSLCCYKILILGHSINKNFPSYSQLDIIYLLFYFLPPQLCALQLPSLNLLPHPWFLYFAISKLTSDGFDLTEHMQVSQFNSRRVILIIKQLSEIFPQQ